MTATIHRLPARPSARLAATTRGEEAPRRADRDAPRGEEGGTPDRDVTRAPGVAEPPLVASLSELRSSPPLVLIARFDLCARLVGPLGGRRLEMLQGKAVVAAIDDDETACRTAALLMLYRCDEMRLHVLAGYVLAATQLAAGEARLPAAGG